YNDDEIIPLARFALDRGLDIAFIEEMPLGEIARNRKAAFMPSHEIRSTLAAAMPLIATNTDSGGPARYYRTADLPGQIGFISPHSDNFCALCNRVRVTAQGRLLLCLGHEHSIDLQAILRNPLALPEALPA